MENKIKELVVEKLKDTEINCPDCEYMYDDDQYTCTTCWCEGGNGKMNVYKLLVEQPDIINI